jgi:hypothetical protein
MSTLAGLLISLAIGLLASLLWVCALFCVKPRLSVEIKPRGPAGPSAGGGWVFTVTNRSWARAVQVQARLWSIELKGDYQDRTPVALKVDTLFQLNGRWAASRRNEQQVSAGIGDNRFRFLTDAAPETFLSDNGRLLFQIWALHGFTNFGRVSTQGRTKAELLGLRDAGQQSAGRSEAPVPPPSAG